MSAWAEEGLAPAAAAPHASVIARQSAGTERDTEAERQRETQRVIAQHWADIEAVARQFCSAGDDLESLSDLDCTEGGREAQRDTESLADLESLPDLDTTYGDYRETQRDTETLSDLESLSDLDCTDSETQRDRDREVQSGTDSLADPELQPEPEPEPPSQRGTQRDSETQRGAETDTEQQRDAGSRTLSPRHARFLSSASRSVYSFFLAVGPMGERSDSVATQRETQTDTHRQRRTERGAHTDGPREDERSDTEAMNTARRVCEELDAAGASH